jgi:hypothetical protein
LLTAGKQKVRVGFAMPLSVKGRARIFEPGDYARHDVQNADASGQAAPPPYISPNQLARRWCVSRSTADRIARRHRFTRFVPGNGANGVVRYLLEEVIRYEQSRLIAPVA